MKPVPICKHCGRWNYEHFHFCLPYEEAEKILDGFEISILDCLQNHGFEPKDSSLANPD